MRHPLAERSVFFLLGLLAVFLQCLPAWGVEQQPQERQLVYVVPVTGDIEPALAAFISRAFETSPGEDAMFVLAIDTFGGRVDTALHIVDTILAVSPRKTVAFVDKKAISAGALIALACNRLAMRPNSTIGDCAPIVYGNEGPKMMGEKFQSPLRAKFRTLARRNGYPPTLAEAMVTAEMVVYQVKLGGKTLYLDEQELADLPPQDKEKITSKKTVVAKGELLTMDSQEAHELGFSFMTADTIEEMLAGMGIERYKIVRIEQSWSESLGRVISAMAPLLLMIGLGALYVELRAPGFGVFGIIGILCLALVFSHQYLVGLADYTELIFIVLGIVLLALEFFVLPGFGIAGIAGFICICLGMILSFQDFVVPDPQLPWQKEIMLKNAVLVIGSYLIALIASLLFMRYLLPRLGSVVKGPYLADNLAGAHVNAQKEHKVRVGDEGTALTFLRPSGKVSIGDEVVDVVSEGDFIEQGSRVVISGIAGNRIVVKRIVDV